MGPPARRSSPRRWSAQLERSDGLIDLLATTTPQLSDESRADLAATIRRTFYRLPIQRAYAYALARMTPQRMRAQARSWKK